MTEEVRTSSSLVSRPFVVWDLEFNVFSPSRLSSLVLPTFGDTVSLETVIHRRGHFVRSSVDNGLDLKSETSTGSPIIKYKILVNLYLVPSRTPKIGKL